MEGSHTGLDALTKVQEHDPVKSLIKSKLSKMQFFRTFTDSDIEILTERLVGYRAEKGDAVFVEGHKAGYLCVVITGQLAIMKDTGTGKSRTLTTVPEGRLIGEMSLIDGEPHSATAVASEPTLLAALTEQSLATLVEDYPALGAKLYKTIAVMISHRLRRTDAELVNYLE